MSDASNTILGLPTIFVVIVAAFIFIVILGVFAFYFNRNFRERRARKLFRSLMQSLEESKRRLALIERHAKEYINHIDPNVRGDLQIAKRLISCTEQMLANTELLLAEGGITNIIEVEEMLDTPLSEFYNPLQSLVTNSELPGIYPHQLEETVDIIFQRVGEEVAKASTQAKRLGFKPRSRGTTVDSLINAGIRYVNRQKRRISSGSFINPNENIEKK